jgi:ATP-dependent helicase/nuclease subunit A
MQGSIRKKGNYWYYGFDVGIVDGKRKRIERKGGSTKKEAQQALRKALREYELTGSLITESDLSVSDFFDYWFKEYVEINCKYKSQINYKRIIDIHIKPYFGVYKLKSLNSRVLQEFLNFKYKEGYSKESLKGFKGVLSIALKTATYPYEFIKENPMLYVTLPKYDERKVDTEKLKVITIDEFQIIIDRFKHKSDFCIPLQIAFNTGMRASEVCGLTWECVDLKNGFVEVKKILLKKEGEWIFGTPKTNSSYRKVPIGSTLIDILRAHRKGQLNNKDKYGKHYIDTNFVCTKENGDFITTDSFKYMSRVINYDLKIDFTFHSLRHTHATMLLEAGANLKEIQNRLGHSKLETTTDTYSHVTKKMNNDTVEIFEEIYTEIF